MEQATKSAIISLDIHKYMRTPHLESSRLQVGDEGHGQVPYAQHKGKYIVLEEKLDGGNCGVSFSAAGELLLQSRGHYLTGGGRERQFNLFKQWAVAHEGWMLERLEDRYVMYGEWMHKKHAMWYDALPHYFCEFDVLDKVTGKFLSTAARRRLLADGPVLSVPVLYDGIAPPKLSDLWVLVKPSLGRTSQWRRAFEAIVKREGLDVEKAWKQCDGSDRAEGLYGKVEEGDETVDRFKLVRPDFVQAILDSEKHHAEQPFIPNLLRPGVDIFAPRLTHGWNAEPW
ncbi:MULTISPECIES: RNA ligase family protein [unclassified Variovorax]|uniref:RNA ligase family protein n=1 Tax=unclassified Variovorax TaxID=663243 RepID=UPI001316E330|nr:MULTISPECIES: RNA ligase family protein [unclassified Variovorax]VTU42779.1 hypothetical protein H6P1_00277 [Variovorax sp. PBL-H6]VTU43686.1 hypothetical protein SRS16P1_00627 [Variovorax sp. SRS16]VTU43749.1 hypothetical protein E5P1_00621 [Variovorax sp. PBL-E5]